eukprot:GEMP01074359.1.p1 GENE.GEMP01074359.1~~GEMP01074359.1.p1  ORF type:complete len:273 (+),score=47.74 GEMP01074359.1:329-1147(+)
MFGGATRSIMQPLVQASAPPLQRAWPSCPSGQRSFSNKSKSNAWIQRHINDRYVIRAQQDLYRSRAAYKLKQMDDQFSFFKKNQTVIDLGCFNGGWSQVAIERSHASSTSSQVIGVDLVQTDPMDHFTFIKGDAAEQATIARVLSILGEKKADVIISDMAPKMIGIKQDDHLSSIELCLMAGTFMERTLKIGGWFVIKIFYGPQLAKFRLYLDTRFQKVRSVKPPASRKSSREMYLVCRHFIGRSDIAEEVPLRGGQGFSVKEGLALPPIRK